MAYLRFMMEQWKWVVVLAVAVFGCWGLYELILYHRT